MQVDNILDAAEKLILEKGAHETSIADIAKEVGISKSSLYYYFESKEELIIAVTERYISVTEKAIEEIISSLSCGVKVETIVKKVTDIIENSRTKTKLHYLLIAYGMTQDYTVEEMIKTRYINWYNLIKNALDAYKKTRYNSAISELILTCVDGYTLHKVLCVDMGRGNNIDKLVKLFKKVCPISDTDDNN